MEQIVVVGKQLTRPRIVRAALAGGSGLLLQTAVFETLSTLTGILSHSSAVVVGGECGVLLSFFLNNRYSFGERRALAGPMWLRLVRYHAVVAGSIAIQWASVFTAEQITNDFYIIHAAYAAGIALGFISNYTGYRLFVWRTANVTPRQQDTKE